jgi:hypothetical protein
MNPAAGSPQPPYVSGVLPEVAVTGFLQSTVIPATWPTAKLIESRVRRLRFSPGEEYAAVATLTLDPAPTVNPQVVLTFTPSGCPAGLDGIYSAELECFAEIFPSDWRLRQLREVLTDDRMVGEIAGSLAIHRGQLELDINLRRYRPHSRAVVEYRLKDVSGATLGEAIGKVYRSKSKARRAWRGLEFIYRQTEAAPVIPRPLRLLEDAALVLMEKAAGRPLAAVLKNESAAVVQQALKRTAGALRDFHAVRFEGLKRRTRQKDLDALAKLVRDAGPGLEAELGPKELVTGIAESLGALPPSGVTTTHGAFKPSAVLLGSERVTFVDLDSCAAGDPARDVACFASKLRSMALDGGSEELSGLAEGFIETYVAGSDDQDLRERVRFYEALYLAGLALKHVNASWRGEAGATPAKPLLELARDVLGQ